MDPLGTAGCVAIAIGVAVGLSFLELICGGMTQPVSVGLLDIDRGGKMGSAEVGFSRLQWGIMNVQCCWCELVCEDLSERQICR